MSILHIQYILTVTVLDQLRYKNLLRNSLLFKCFCLLGHPLPCDCGSAKCRLIAALMQKYDEEQTALELEAEEMDACAATEAARNVDLVENSGINE